MSAPHIRYPEMKKPAALIQNVPAGMPGCSVWDSQVVFVEVAVHGGQIETALATFYSARNELFAQDYQKARDLFSRALEYSEELSDMDFQVKCVRALGEIALLEKDFTGANIQFAKAKSLCDDMGIHPDFLYNGLEPSRLKASHEGWKLFLEGRLPSS
ncbi:hypothetical protein BJ138DRAFT_1200161 [Hygrophoropsis aurantiaca]|uniref:Uncharacterized protein n=1 Tax=Hygrophoropsis aurantiaca TaxID=72124 RepID=A0ACB7ZQC1_9AGAM|nr:hypothetical protein BJ138DRAFT_1200161 [Hygrophoropsis aurantiaca]